MLTWQLGGGWLAESRELAEIGGWWQIVGGQEVLGTLLDRRTCNERNLSVLAGKPCTKTLPVWEFRLFGGWFVKVKRFIHVQMVPASGDQFVPVIVNRLYNILKWFCLLCVFMQILIWCAERHAALWLSSRLLLK